MALIGAWAHARVDDSIGAEDRAGGIEEELAVGPWDAGGIDVLGRRRALEPANDLLAIGPSSSYARIPFVLATDLDRLVETAPKDGRGRHLELAALRPLLARIIEHWQPLQIWLFGSRARGDASPTSDWDLFVVAPDDLPDRGLDDPLIAWRLRRESGVRADVITCRARDFVEDRSTPNTMALEVATDGVLIYER